jgi:beta-N-acetylhexosaminidase
VHRFGPEVERLPPSAWYWEFAVEEGRQAAFERLEADASRSGAEIRALGITMNLAPVAEILNDGNRPFLDERSYGSDAAFILGAAQAFIRGMKNSGIAWVVKHFPGNSGTDPHTEKGTLAEDRETLDSMVAPFKTLIQSPSFLAYRPSGIMVSHVVASARDPDKNASLSPLVVKSWLRDELGYTGICLGDDFSMPAVSSSDADVRDKAIEALNAGIDMVMVWPRNTALVHGAIVDALETGKLSRERLREAAGRILFEKLRFGLIDED